MAVEQDHEYRPRMLRFMRLELMLIAFLVILDALMLYKLWIPRPVPVFDPPARYVQFGLGPLILDTQTGKVCNSYVNEPQLPGGYPLCPGVGK